MKLEIGKKYTLERWDDTEVYLECLAIGNESWFWRDQDGVEMHSVIDDEWLPYEEEKKESIMNAEEEARRIVKEFWLASGYDQDIAKDLARVAVRMLISESRGKFYYEVLKEIEKV